MTAEVEKGSRSGIAKAPPSKSYAHRLLIAAALSDKETVVGSVGESEDIEATIDCLQGLGAKITKNGSGSATVVPVVKNQMPAEGGLLRCRESGSTLRFLIPVAGALGREVTFKMEGRLPERPIGEYADALEKGGMKIEKEGDLLKCSGRLKPGTYEIPGNVSSQYISGLLFALTLLPGESRIGVKGRMESKGYADMTAEALDSFGAKIERTENGYVVKGKGFYEPPFERTETEGDWSGAAFLLCAGAFSEKGITVTGLNLKSTQGDRRIADILRKFGASVTEEENSLTVRKGDLKGIVIDAREIPDLAPALAVTACGATGETVIINAGRLRFKETDRIRTTAALINSLGGQADETEDGLLIKGRDLTGGLRGGKCSSFSDHRIAMSAALAACIAKENVIIENAECVRKSFPDFFEVFGNLRTEV